MSSNGVKMVLYGDFKEYPIAGDMFPYTFNTNQLENLLRRYGPYRTSLVVKANRIPELQNIINEYCIYEIFVSGDCAEFNIQNKKVKIHETNAQDFRFDVLCAAARYTHREEIIQKNSGNHGVANSLRIDCRNLLKQIKETL